MRNVFYTVNFGGYDTPKKPCEPGLMDWDFIVLVNKETPREFVEKYKEYGWNAVLCEHMDDNETGSTYWKIMGPCVLEGENFIYIDASINLKVDASSLWQNYMNDEISKECHAAFSPWPYWRGFEAELGRSVLTGHISLDNAKKQLEEYVHLGMIFHQQKVFCGGVCLRKKGELCQQFCDRWWHNYCRFPWRDQPPLMATIVELNASISPFPMNLWRGGPHSEKNSAQKYKERGYSYHWDDYQHIKEHREKIDYCAGLLADSGLVLDFGCGDGVATWALSKTNKVIGVDIEEGALEVAASKTDPEKCQFYKNIPDLEYDGILCMDSLEHIENSPNGTLAYLIVWAYIRKCRNAVITLPAEDAVDEYASRRISDSIMELEGFKKDKKFGDAQVWVRAAIQ